MTSPYQAYIDGRELFVDGKCVECGSSVHGPQRGQHKNFHANYIHRSEVKDGFAVSTVVWCDLGDHAFKADSPGSQSLNVVQRGDDGEEKRVMMDMCAKHAFPTASPVTNNPTMRAVESAYNSERRAASVDGTSGYPSAATSHDHIYED